MVEKHKRTMVKAATYRVFATLTVFTVAFAFTEKIKSAASIGLAAAVAKTFLYYIWERLWSNIGWGLEIE